MHVVYGFPNLKIHAKATLVVRREGDRLRRYVHIGTGNYNSVTARVVRGHRPLHRGRGHRRRRRRPVQLRDRLREPQRFRKLLVAPFNLRDRIVEEIRAVAAAGEQGPASASR